MLYLLGGITYFYEVDLLNNKHNRPQGTCYGGKYEPQLMYHQVR